MVVLPELISVNQTAFIRGRRISDAIGLAQEFTQSFNCKSTSKRACITIDFAKAFDTLRWDVIDTVMELMGIDHDFRKLVMSCVTTASASALVEGSPTKIVKLQRGLRQGDPLSPLLFVIVIEYLSRLINQAMNNRKIDLYKSRGMAVESHLAYADDVTFFCRASAKTLTTLTDILAEFEAFSGLKINAGKARLSSPKGCRKNHTLQQSLGSKSANCQLGTSALR